VLIEERVRAHLSPDSRFRQVELLERVDSTNRVVAERAGAGEPEGLVVAADVQTAGRGRLDRTWEAAPGSALLVSVLLRPDLLRPALPPPRWYLLTAAAGLAAAGACEEVAGFRPELKWPNDLLVSDGRKLAGILAEATAGAVVVGMGLNVHAAPPGAAWADEAAGRTVDRSDLLGTWLSALDRWLGDWPAVAGAYRRSCRTLGRRVVVEQAGVGEAGAGGAGGRVEGMAEGIDDDGRLLVREEAGDVVAVSAGDVVHVRPAAGS
jgi:BirA family biotin operon repressor/biotin-[acetyl-CoA-carboxylase] ligase